MHKPHSPAQLSDCGPVCSISDDVVLLSEMSTMFPYSPRSQEVFRQAMTSPLVRLEVLPAANKPRYEKSLIGQLFTGDSKESTAKTKSPTMARAKTDSQPQPKLNSKSEVRQPDTHARTPEPAAENMPSIELHAKQGSLERFSPTPGGREASSSPTPRTPSQSPLASKGPVLPGLATLTSKKGGKRIKIDLKKGKYTTKFCVIIYLLHRDRPQCMMGNHPKC